MRAQLASGKVENILSELKSLRPDEQIVLAEAIDQLTWVARWRRICERIEASRGDAPQVPDEEIDREVEELRREKPLSARSSTHRS